MTAASHSNESLHSYVTGFILSLILTFLAYFVVTHKLLANSALVFSINGLAFMQVWVQLHFFLHLGKETKPRWNFIIFLFMVMVLAILVFGSLWIMSELNNNVMPYKDISLEQLKEKIIQSPVAK